MRTPWVSAGAAITCNDSDQVRLVANPVEAIAWWAAVTSLPAPSDGAEAWHWV